MRWLMVATLGMVLGGWHSAATAQTDPGPTATVHGYVRSITVYQDLGYQLPNTDRRALVNGEVARLKWTFDLTKNLTVSLHNRLQVLATSAHTSTTRLTGVGVSAVPNRSIGLETELLNEPHVRSWHDVDRLNINLQTSVADITIGRQAITWGVANLFPVADLWTQFSPFELDTEEKPGVDAIRVLSYPSANTEVDAVLVDRGSRGELSGGVRTTVALPFGDVYAAAGKFWRQVAGIVGGSFVVDAWKVRGEVTVPWNVDTDEFQPVRTTFGIDRIDASYQVTFEYHYNGLGVTRASAYAQQVTSPALQRGETYFLGRHYVGASVSYVPTDRWVISNTVLTNLQDPSASWSPNIGYDLGRSMRLTAGALVGLGTKPLTTPTTIDFKTEFGAYGTSLYVGATAFF